MSKRKKKTKKKQSQSKYILILFILIIVISFTTKEIINIYNKNSIIFTEKNISFQYKENDNLISINNPQILTDTKGKQLKSYYSYNIKNNSNESIEYQVILTPINMNNTNNIKVYLTDDNNKDLLKNEVVKLYNEFKSIEQSKIIYNGVLKSKSEENQRLRLWLNDKNDNKLNFKISIKIKNR